MSDTDAAPQDAPKKRAGGLNTMLIADLRSMATGLGISGSGSMKKADLVSAIKAAQSGGQSGGQSRPSQDQPRQDQPSQEQPRQEQPRQEQPKQQQPKGKQNQQNQQNQPKRDQKQGDQNKQGQAKDQKQGQNKQDQKQEQNKQDQGKQDQGRQDQGRQDQQADADDGQGDGSSRSRRRRGRERNRATAPTGGGGRNEPDTTILEDDVLVPAAGIIDVLDNYAFVRTSGYLAGPDDVYLSLSLVRKFNLRPGDAVVGQVRQPREGERREKFNPMVRIDSVNGADPEATRDRPEFERLTPLHPDERLRLETGPDDLVGRVIDLVAPLGKGQRALVVSPAKAGKTTVLQSIAAAVTANNPECHLMVVLVDERPEEVTDFQRSVQGEVISSTFDRPAGDHTAVAELALERAKRLVELGHDVVVLLDGLTRLGRAYNMAAPANGRVLAAGVDASALYPPKRFFGAARNLEDGGSLTIVATAQVESGSTMDEVIFEELEGTGNAEIRLRGDLAERRVFPAIDVLGSATRHEEQLLTQQEQAVLGTLRRELGRQDPAAATESLLARLGASRTNVELLMQVQRGS